MSSKYTSSTSALKAVTIDSHIIKTNKFYVKKNLSDTDYVDILKLSKNYEDERGENVTENDLWGTSVTTDGEKVKIGHKYLSTEGKTYGDSESDLKLTFDKLYVNDEFNANIQTERIIELNNSPFIGKSLSVEGDLSKLKICKKGFENANFKSVEFDLPSLVIGEGSFKGATFPEQSFSRNLENLHYGVEMFKDTKGLNDFLCSIPYCYDAKQMFANSEIKNFRGSTNYLYDGTGMFYNSSLKTLSTRLQALITGIGMFENTELSLKAVETIAYTLPSLVDYSIITNKSVDENGEVVDVEYEFVNAFENGVYFNYLVPSFKDGSIGTRPFNLTILPESVGVITITWKDPSSISLDEAVIIEHEYFRLMELKGWTVVSNLVEKNPGKIYKRTFSTENPINNLVENYESVGTLIVGYKANLWTEEDVENEE